MEPWGPWPPEAEAVGKKSLRSALGAFCALPSAMSGFLGPGLAISFEGPLVVKCRAKGQEGF